MFEIIFKYLTVEESSRVFPRVCRPWRHLHLRMFYSYSSTLRSIDNSSLTSKEMQVILERGSNLAHVRLLGDIVKKDFRNQVKFFNQNIVLQAKVAENLFNTNEEGTLIKQTKGRLF